MEIQNTKYLVWIVAALVIGFVVNMLLDPYLPSSLSNAKKGYQAGFDATKQLVENSSLGNFFRAPSSNQNDLFGTVTAINGGSITIRVPSTNPFDDPALGERTVLTTADTKVIRFTKVDATGKTAATVQSTKADLSSIKVDDSLYIVAGGSIATAKEFTATEIQIQP